VPFLFWWMIFMPPWLREDARSPHIAVPAILLAGQFASGWKRGGVKPSERLALGRSAALGLLAILAVLTVRTTAAVNYTNYDYTTEYIDYAHGAPGVKWVLDDLAAIANHTGAGKNLKVAYDDEVSWPMSCTCDYPNRLSMVRSRQALDAPVVIAGPKNWDKVESSWATGFTAELIRLW
jgi:hypothetical protein